jgi:DNA-binding NarL/FixJ family response regulator
MATVLALSADLLFGSRLQAALQEGGHEVALVGEQARLRERLADPEGPPDVLVVDLVDAALAGIEVVRALERDGLLAGTRTLGFYSHVDVATRERAQEAGFDLVVPRSRMAREGAAVVARLIGSKERA